MSSSSSFQSSLQEVRDDNKFKDVTLASEDCQLVEAHKVILVGCSPQTNTPALLSKLTGSSSNVENEMCRGLQLFYNGIYLVSEAIIPKGGAFWCGKLSECCEHEQI